MITAWGLCLGQGPIACPVLLGFFRRRLFYLLGHLEEELYKEIGYNNQYNRTENPVQNGCG